MSFFHLILLSGILRLYFYDNLSDYTVGTQVLVAEYGVKLADQVGKFAVTPQTTTGGTTNWTINTDGYLKQQQ